MIDKFFNGFIGYLMVLDTITTYKFIGYMIFVILIWFLRNIVIRYAN